MSKSDSRPNSSGRSALATILLVVDLLLLVGACALGAAAVFSPSWQVVDIREFRVEHHHGLWLDCSRAERPIAEHEHQLNRHFVDNDALHCVYKFQHSAAVAIDENLAAATENSAAAESEHHIWHGWHKAALVFIGLALILAGLGLLLAFCAPCSPSAAIIFSATLFFAFLTSSIADAVFFFAAHRVDNRFVQGLVGTYEQGIGSAFWLHLGSTLLLLFAFILGLVATYHMLSRSNRTLGADEVLPLRQLAPIYSRHSQYSR